MKTFKLCSLVILVDNEMEPKEIPLVDGLIINKEDTQKNWLIEAVVPQEYEDYFQKLHETQDKIMVEVTITRKTNDPASFYCLIRGIKKIKDHTSILLDGLLVAKDDDFTDKILRSILEEGFSGEAILREFKRRKKDRGKAIRGALNNTFIQVKGKFFV